MDQVLVISPLFPPLQGGLPDHTDRLAHALALHGTVSVLSSVGVTLQRSFPVHATVRDWHDADALLAAITAAAPEGPILWQYVPHMYGRGGVNLAVPRVLRRLRNRHRHQVVIAHEIAAPFSLWPHRSAYALAHRLMWRGLHRSADAIGISTDAWLARLDARNVAPGRLFLAPSPSNLPVAPVPSNHREGWRLAHGVADAPRVVGFFGSHSSAKQFDWVLAAWRAIRLREPGTALVVVGGRPAIRLDPAEEPDFRALGYLPGPDASEALQAMDILALPFVDGVSERRSSFMAGLAHGLPVATTWGPATGANLRNADCCAGTSVDAGIETFAAAAAALAADPAARARMVARAREHYAATYDWPRLASILTHRLYPDGNPAPGGPRAQLGASL